MGDFLKQLLSSRNIKAEIETDRNRDVVYPVFTNESNKIGFTARPDAQQESLDRIAMQISWVFSAINLIAGKMSAANYQVAKRVSEKMEPVIDHPFEMIMRQPNPFMGGAYLKAYSAWWLMLRGEAAWALVPDQTGQLVELWPLPSDRIIPIEDDKEYVSGYWYFPRYNVQEPIPLKREEVCYFKTPNPFDYRRGLSPLTGIRRAIETDYLSSKWNLSTFKNEATLRQIFSLPADLRSDRLRVLRDEITRELSLGKRYMVVRGGDVKVDTVGLSHKDMEYLEARTQSRDEIDRNYGIPGGYWSALATRSNAEAARLALAEDAIIPKLTLMGEDIDTQILRRYYDDETLVSKWEDVRPRDQKVEIAQKKVRYDSMTINEVRAEEGRAKLDTAWGELPWALRTSPNAMQFVLSETIDTEGSVGSADLTSGDGGTGGGKVSGIGEPREPRGTDVNNTDPEGMGEPGIEAKAAVESLAKQAELKQWKAVALRMEGKGKSPLDYNFEIQAITPGEGAFIRQAIAFGANTKHALKSLFTDFDTFYTKATADDVLEREFPLSEAESREYYDKLDELTVQYQEKTINRQQFINRVEALARTLIIYAFLTGAGVETVSDLTDEDREQIEESVTIHRTSAEMLANDIDADAYNPDVNENAETSRGSRLSLWLLALAGIFYLGQLAGDDTEMIGWRYGETEHCEDCVRLHGQQHTRAEWRKSGWYPRAYHLACKGYWCQCRFAPGLEGESIGSF